MQKKGYRLMNRLNGRNLKLFKKIVILAALSIGVLSCASYFLEKPSFALRKITLSPRSFTEMNLVLGVEVQNPNRFDLKLTSFEYSVFLKNEAIGNGRLEKELMIPASATTEIEAPVTAKFKSLGESLMTLITGNDIPYRIEGKVEVKTFFGSRTFPFSKDGRINSKTP
jgi:LEA14-like dessication related protein